MGNSQSIPQSNSTSTANLLEPVLDAVDCAICLENCEDAVALGCGHAYCKGCIKTHLEVNENLCPKCRRSCDQEHIVPLLRPENTDEITDYLTAPGQTMQLIRVNEDNKDTPLELDANVLKLCFLREDVRDIPVCILSIVGQRRCGKSFLLNYISRRLGNLECEDDSWMREDEEVLNGFEWRTGDDSITKGIWIWSKPFFMKLNEGERIAVFLVDTEGSADAKQNKEVGLKLSALSALFSSYLIFNISSRINSTDLEDLEMFCLIAENGETGLKPFQRLLFLIRDWYLPPVGFEGGMTHLGKVATECPLQNVKDILQKKEAECFLMPHPGKKLPASNEGGLKDMDDDFKECLKQFINYLVRTLSKYPKMDRENSKIMGRQLKEHIQKVTSVIASAQYDIVSIREMTIQQNFQNAKLHFQKFISDKGNTFLTTPDQMKKEVEEKVEKILTDVKFGEEDLEKLKTDLNTEKEEFLKKYKTKFKISAGVLATGSVLATVAGGVVAGVGIAAEAGIIAAGAAVGTGSSLAVGGIGAAATQIAKRIKKNTTEPEDNN
ncbi:RING finger protein 112-like [Acipenser oxyrinchus oxyrinchus]|uniref:RING finger protein 112-like n=1 Tax=Acipenser oxyrinchus oxyrinchus TaxID=40147 RepID=A0AAD8CLT4_ACIOX|nr:RING finger protein 112-like [Acipenser oxyrinchus oxyrinchus]